MRGQIEESDGDGGRCSEGYAVGSFRVPTSFGRLVAVALRAELRASLDNENGIVFAPDSVYLFGLRLASYISHRPLHDATESISLWFTAGIFSRAAARRELYDWAVRADPTPKASPEWRKENRICEGCPVTIVGNTVMVQLVFDPREATKVKFADVPREGSVRL
jgi:hypothetical protein